MDHATVVGKKVQTSLPHRGSQVLNHTQPSFVHHL